MSFFAAASRKSKGTYKTQADLKKAGTTQIAVSRGQHLGSGLPFAWNRGGSADSERSLRLNMLDNLPSGGRLVMDAYYFGDDFWTQLIDGGFTFVVRAGKNIYLLRVLKETGEVKCRDGLVFYWPQTAIDRDAKPIVLQLVEVMVGRKRTFLLTNELELTDQQLSAIYAARRGIELTFRMIKKNLERAKLDSRTPKNVVIELDWTLLAVWTQSVLRSSIHEALSRSVVADESGRKIVRKSNGDPRKKKQRQTGEPTINELSEALWEKANAMLV